MRRLTRIEEVEEAGRRIAGALAGGGEWLLREGRAGSCVELREGEWDLSVAAGALRLSYRGAGGARAWRVVAYGREGEKLLLGVRRRMGAEALTLELVPRASFAAAREAVADARRAACGRLAALVCREARAEALRVRLSEGRRRGEPGRYMRAVLARRRGGARVAATGPVVAVGAEEAEAFLTSALIWHARLEEKSDGRRPLELLLVAPRPLAEATGERLALLREDLRARVSLLEAGGEPGGLTPLAVPTLEELLGACPPRLARPPEAEPGGLARAVMALAPEAVDVVRARRGETLRFRGLAFARVRRLKGSEHLWFGTGGAAGMRLLDEESRPDFLRLLEELEEHRRAGAADRRHALYRAAPEA